MIRKYPVPLIQISFDMPFLERSHNNKQLQFGIFQLSCNLLVLYALQLRFQ